jgi:peptidoglycan/LPS O-acetylase OafA/YrhL
MNRFQELDGIRGIASAGVVAFHVCGLWLFWYWSLMEMFFILSGFVITRTFLRYAANWRFAYTFLLRRALRLWPTYFCVLLVAYLIYLAAKLIGVGPSDRDLGFLQMAAFTQFVEWYVREEFFSEHYVGYLIHTWSLAVEEQFYVIWVVAFLGLCARSRLYVPLVAVSLIVAGVLARAQGMEYWLLAVHLDSFGAGILGAYLHERFLTSGRNLLAARAICLAALAAGVALFAGYVGRGYAILQFEEPTTPFFEDVTFTHLGFVIFWFGVLGLSVLAPGADEQRVLRSGTAQFLGRISYSLYLVHFPLVILTGSAFVMAGLPDALGKLMGGLCSFVLAWLTFIWVERPSLLAKERLNYIGAAPELDRSRPLKSMSA